MYLQPEVLIWLSCLFFITSLEDVCLGIKMAAAVQHGGIKTCSALRESTAKTFRDFLLCSWTMSSLWQCFMVGLCGGICHATGKEKTLETRENHPEGICTSACSYRHRAWFREPDPLSSPVIGSRNAVRIGCRPYHTETHTETVMGVFFFLEWCFPTFSKIPYPPRCKTMTAWFLGPATGRNGTDS